MGTKNNPAPNDCYSMAEPDEPMFILLARDPDAAQIVDLWATLRKRRVDRGFAPLTDQAKINEAFACAVEMRRWRTKNRPGHKGEEGDSSPVETREMKP